jgi:hypothetical protein
LSQLGMNALGKFWQETALNHFTARDELEG